MPRQQKKPIKKLKILDIESQIVMVDKQLVVKSAMKKINNQLSYIRLISYYFYNFLTFYISWLKWISVKKIKCKQVIFINEIRDVFLGKSDIYLTDSALCIKENEIPYESIVFSKKVRGYVFLDVFSSLDKNKIVLSEDIIHICIQLDKPDIFLLTLKFYMFYHIKYNKLNQQILSYYCKKLV